MQEKIAIGYVTAMWGRHWLTEQVFRYVNSLRQRLAPQIELVPAVAGSEGEISRRIASENGFLYVETDNSPLGAKWNAALGLLKNLPLAGVCIFGSDDLANERYFTDLARLIREGHELVALSGLYFFEQESHRLLHWKGYPAPRENDSAGAGRFISRPILERLDWRLWPNNVQGGLDRAMRSRLMVMDEDSFKLLPCRDSAGVVVDIKGKGGMNSFEAIAACGESMIFGKAKEFFQRNFGETLTNVFFVADRETICAETQDALLWRAWQDAEGKPGRPTVWCVEEDRFSAPAMDFMTAVLQGGLGARWISAGTYRDAPPLGDNDLFYARLGASSLLAQLMDADAPKVLDDRESPIQSPRGIIDELPWPCIRPDGQGTMPLPFSHPPDYPAFEQRRHIVCCIESAILWQAMVETWMNMASKQYAHGQNLFFTELGGMHHGNDKGIFSIGSFQVFPLRALFRLVIFTPSTYSRLASYFLAGGTPGICLGHWTLGDVPDGLIVTTDLGYAMRIAARIVGNEKMWSRRAQAIRGFSQKQAQIFRDTLFSYIDSIRKSAHVPS